MATPSRTISASTQNRIMIWRSEVASAVDDAASSAASSTGHTASLSDGHSSAGRSSSRSAVIARGRRFWHRLTRRLSGGRFGGMDEDMFQREHMTRTAMYRALPPADARGVMATEQRGLDLDMGDEESSHARGGLREKQERLERAARLLEQ
ncbi:hypothetical protein E4U22_002236 [Claviceps purpurea]|nr:hypothetical protein E4U50_008011 [Claviceps purpurea]KAG6321210.1 hypothetical protein E4U22_002236 [Claviceps purpurea]